MRFRYSVRFVWKSRSQRVSRQVSLQHGPFVVQEFSDSRRLGVAVQDGDFQRLQHSELGHARECEPDLEHECNNACEQRWAHHDACAGNQSAADPVWLETDVLMAVTHVIRTVLVIAVLMLPFSASAQTANPRVFIL